MPRPGYLAVLAFLPLPAASQVNLEEGSAGAQDCPGVSREIALAPAGFIGLDGDVARLDFGGLGVCLTGTEVIIGTVPPLTLDCAEIRDSDDEGIGHYFTAEGIPHHLWLHIPSDSAAPTLEIGLYREDTELAWIDTGYPICRN